jgi:hypothetical protein
VRSVTSRLLLVGSGSIRIDDLEISSGGWLKISGQSAQVNSDIVVSNYMEMSGGVLTVAGSMTVPGGCSLISNVAIRIDHNLTMIGNIDHSGGDGSGLSVGGFVSWQPQSGEALPDTMSAGSLLVHTSGSLTVPDTLEVIGLLQVASSLTVNGGSVVHDLEILNGGTLTLNSLMVVNGSVSVRAGGTITHAATSNTAATVQLRVTGVMTVDSGGQINADQRSIYYRSCPDWTAGAIWPSHGGRGQDGSAGGSNDVYGNFQAVDTLGQANNGRYSSGWAGGGLIRITAGSLVLNGAIRARGYAQSTGGGIGIVITGGSVTGTGVLDVSVDSGSTTNAYYRAGGGRISITGYSTISDAVVANALMDGSRWYGSGAGTFFYQSRYAPFGNLLVSTSAFTASALTPILGAIELCNITEVRARVYVVTSLDVCGVCATQFLSCPARATSCASCFGTVPPSAAPTAAPTSAPSTATPTTSPTHFPTFAPSNAPTWSPTVTPTALPTYSPTTAPTYSPTFVPTFNPTAAPSTSPTYPPGSPTPLPTHQPTSSPTSRAPIASPTTAPTHLPAAAPTAAPVVATGVSDQVGSSSGGGMGIGVIVGSAVGILVMVAVVIVVVARRRKRHGASMAKEKLRAQRPPLTMNPTYTQRVSQRQEASTVGDYLDVAGDADDDVGGGSDGLGRSEALTLTSFGAQSTAPVAGMTDVSKGDGAIHSATDFFDCGMYVADAATANRNPSVRGRTAIVPLSPQMEYVVPSAESNPYAEPPPTIPAWRPSRMVLSSAKGTGDYGDVRGDETTGQSYEKPSFTHNDEYEEYDPDQVSSTSRRSTAVAPTATAKKPTFRQTVRQNKKDSAPAVPPKKRAAAVLSPRPASAAADDNDTDEEVYEEVAKLAQPKERAVPMPTHDTDRDDEYEVPDRIRPRGIGTQQPNENYEVPAAAVDSSLYYDSRNAPPVPRRASTAPTAADDYDLYDPTQKSESVSGRRAQPRSLGGAQYSAPPRAAGTTSSRAMPADDYDLYDPTQNVSGRRAQPLGGARYSAPPPAPMPADDYDLYDPTQNVSGRRAQQQLLGGARYSAPPRAAGTTSSRAMPVDDYDVYDPTQNVSGAGARPVSGALYAAPPPAAGTTSSRATVTRCTYCRDGKTELQCKLAPVPGSVWCSSHRCPKCGRSAKPSRADTCEACSESEF